MKSSIDLVPENLLASHKSKLYAEDITTSEELELIEKIKDKVLEKNISLISHYYTDTIIKNITKNSMDVFLTLCKWLSLEKNLYQMF